MSVYAQSAMNFYSTISYSRPPAKQSRVKFMSTGLSNPENQIRPFTSAMSRSNSAFKNARGRLDLLTQNIGQLAEEVRVAQTSTKEMRLHLDFMKTELYQKDLPALQADLTKQIKQLQKQVSVGKGSDMLSFEALQYACKVLQKNSRQIAGNMAEIDARVTSLENALGFHGLKDRLKY